MPYKNPEDQRRSGRSHYQANKDVYKARAAAHKQKHRRLIREHVIRAKQRPCTDCAVQYPPHVMQFDHRGESPKEFTIANLSRQTSSLKRLADEIAKCDVVCANCHAERTYRRGLVDESGEDVGGGTGIRTREPLGYEPSALP